MGDFTPPGELLRMIKKFPDKMKQTEGRFLCRDNQTA